MRLIYMSDVADGFCFGLHTSDEVSIQVDCGSKQGGEIALEGWRRMWDWFFGPFYNSPDVFILSHFHIDHYNGLLLASSGTTNFPRLEIKKVYFPGAPKFPQSREFFDALFCMNMRVFGEETGLMAYDFLKSIKSINRRDFSKKPLFKDDVIKIKGSHFEVLWPPRVLEEKDIVRPIQKALTDFNKALEVDKELRRIHDLVSEEGLFEKLMEGGLEESSSCENSTHLRRRKSEVIEEHPLPRIVNKANKSLRCAANHLSLAFFGDNRFLFLGDLESREINRVVNDLSARERTHFDVFIAPHHGTHWHNSLERMRFVFTLISSGPKLCAKFETRFKRISKFVASTHFNGDLNLPFGPFPTFGSVPYWAWLF